MAVRVLLLDDDAGDAITLEHELGERHDVRTATTLAGALRVLDRRSWWPEAIVTGLDLPDSKGIATLESLQASALGVPVLVSNGGPGETLAIQLDALAAVHARDKNQAQALLRAVIQNQQVVYRTIAQNRAQLLEEIDRVANRTAEKAVAGAVERLLARLGLADGEGLQLAIRFARSFELARIRFWSAVATGLGTAFLVALGTGIIAMFRNAK